MLLKAGAFSLALLLASRVLGLLRESALAATFGASALADVAVLMLTLPDWVAGVLASGALAYVLLPHWAQQTPAQLAAVQRRVGLVLLGIGLVLGGSLVFFRSALMGWLAAGLPASLQGDAALALVWAALGLPAALLAALGVTRLQHERDFTGLYGANLVVNGVLVATLLLMAQVLPAGGSVVVPDGFVGVQSPFVLTAQLGVGLCLAMGARLGWLHWRLRPFRSPPSSAALGPDTTVALPTARLWLWAALSAGLPLTLPFVARSLASAQGAGALATFNYAWKLVELPLMLAVQLVATLAFPGIARAMLQGAGLGAEARQLIRNAFALAWVLACAAALALQVGAVALADLLLGWGRMDAQALIIVADWGRTAAWGLLPQALIAVAVTVLAVQSRLWVAVLAYAMALGLLLLCGPQLQGGAALMCLLNGLHVGVALLMLLALAWPLGGRVPAAPDLLPWGALLVPALVLGAGGGMVAFGVLANFEEKGLSALLLSALSAIFLIAISTALSPSVRHALRR